MRFNLFKKNTLNENNQANFIKPPREQTSLIIITIVEGSALFQKQQPVHHKMEISTALATLAPC